MSGIAILGGSGGLGAAVARRVARRTPVTLGYNQSPDRAEALADELREAGGTATVASADVTDADSIRAFLEQAAEAMGGVDHVVQATGPRTLPFGPLNEVPADEFQAIMQADVFGSFNTIRAASPFLARSGGGGIVLFCTTAVLRTLEDDGMSGVPKTAVSALLRQAAREVGKDNVRLNGIAPGVIDAGIVLEGFVGEAAKNVLASCMAQTPLGRMGRPEEIGALADFLCSDDAAYISGQIIAVDGGYSA